MKATTIKLEGDLLKQLETVKPESMSVSAFVREVLERDIRQRRMASAASEYRNFIESNPEEKRWLREWEKADLIAPPKGKRR
jgi:predicted CopG family antitoxin